MNRATFEEVTEEVTKIRDAAKEKHKELFARSRSEEQIKVVEQHVLEVKARIEELGWTRDQYDDEIQKRMEESDLKNKKEWWGKECAADQERMITHTTLREQGEWNSAAEDSMKNTFGALINNDAATINKD